MPCPLTIIQVIYPFDRRGYSKNSPNRSFPEHAERLWVLENKLCSLEKMFPKKQLRTRSLATDTQISMTHPQIKDPFNL